MEVLVVLALGIALVVAVTPRGRRGGDARPSAPPRGESPERRSPGPARPAPPAPPARVVRHLPERVTGKAWVIDGDTIVIGRTRIRLFGIDAPELDHPWGRKSKWEMVRLCRGQTITAHVTGEMSHDRVVARCHLPDGRDLSAELVRAGLAIDWPKYSGGVYRALEPDGIRRRHWRAAARQQGRMPG